MKIWKNEVKSRELIPSTFISPKYLPKDIGPVPKINSKKIRIISNNK